jgi:hypothetical protein
MRVICLFLLTLFSVSAHAAERTVRFVLDGRAVEGTPLVWTTNFGAILARDGRWINVDPGRVEGHREVASTFRPYLATELRGLLQQEFGRTFEVTGAGHYLVVHARGEGASWAPRFEELYRSFQHYFTARGWRPAEPKFPLVAVVFPERQAFEAYAAREGSQLPPGTLGYYSPATNRIALYDTQGTQTTDWTLNAETILHEAAHQTAFNTGVHNRFSQPPRWVTEGVGMLFEARGVWDSTRFRSRSDRVNQYRLAAFKRYADSRRKPGALAELVSSDRSFTTDVDGAYAEAWAITFFLSETHPRQYVEYLRKTAGQANFTERRSNERLADFTGVFGENLRLLEAQMLAFMGEIK